MEILLEMNLCESLVSDDVFELTEIDKDNIRKQVELGCIRSVELVNIGPGADYFVLLLVVDIALRMLKIGTEVNDGIDAWISLGNKLRNLFRKRKIVSVDIDGATSIAIALIAQREKIVKLEKLQEATINLVDLSSMLPQNVGLSKAPHNYYIQTYRINDDEIYVVGITSEGKANVIKHFGYSRYRIKDVK